MEADQVTGKPQTTTKAEEHTSSKDPSTEDFQQLATSETNLEPSIPETPLVPLTSESHLVPSSLSQAPLEIHPSAAILEPDVSETPLVALTSESPVMPSPSQIPLETHTSETTLESSITEAPLEAPISESHEVLPSPSHTPLETHTSEAILGLSASEMPLETLTSESPVMPLSQTQLQIHPSVSPMEPSKHLSEHSTSEFPLEIQVPEVPKDLIQTSAPGQSFLYFSDERKEDLLFPSSSEVSRRAFQISESETPQQHTPSGSSAQIHLDTSAKQRGEEIEEKGVDVTDSTAHTAQPEYQLGKKKGKKGVSSYPVQPEVPAKQGELVEVAKGMPREKFDAQVQYRFQWEKNTALYSIQTGLYIGWRCPHYLWDCFRIGNESKCFCGHLLKEHRIISDISVPCNVSQCRCLMFCFIPSCPEEVGEFWLKRRATFDPKAWRAQCRCKHSHEEHAATSSHPCRVRGCCCNCFESNFLCAACDRRWEEHETYFDTEGTRRRGGRLHGTDTVNTCHRPL